MSLFFHVVSAIFLLVAFFCGFMALTGNGNALELTALFSLAALCLFAGTAILALSEIASHILRLQRIVISGSDLNLEEHRKTRALLEREAERRFELRQ